MMTVLFCLIALTIVLIGGAYYGYRTAFYVPKTGSEENDPVQDPNYTLFPSQIIQLYEKLAQRPCQRVSIQSFDGLTLSGRYYEVQKGAPLDLCFHGYRSSGPRDFCGGAQMSLQMGHNLLLVDQRAHERSEGHTISFGINERQDVLRWVNYAVQTYGPDCRILLYGVSMGAATVLMASDLALPDNVKGIIADCPYDSPLGIIQDVGKRQNIPAVVTRIIVPLGAWLFGHFNLEATDPVRAVSKTKLPILIIHGDGDTFVPCGMSEHIRQANPANVTRVVFPGAEHAVCCLTDPQRYHAVVRDFAKKIGL